MRDPEVIEKELFEARQNLEENIEQLAHRVREKTAIGARLQHVVREHVSVIALVAGGLFVLAAIGKIRRARAAATV